MAHEEALLSHDDGGEAGLVADGGGRQHSFATFGSGMSGSHRHTVGGRRSLTSASMIDGHLRPDSRDPPNTETESVVKVEDGVELDVNIDNWHIWRCVFILHLFYIVNIIGQAARIMYPESPIVAYTSMELASSCLLLGYCIYLSIIGRLRLVPVHRKSRQQDLLRLAAMLPARSI